MPFSRIKALAMPTARCVFPVPIVPTSSRPVLSTGYSSTNRHAGGGELQLRPFKLVVREFAMLISFGNPRRREHGIGAGASIGNRSA